MNGQIHWSNCGQLLITMLPLYCFPNGEMVQWLIFWGQKCLNGEVMICWNGEMVQWFEYVHQYGEVVVTVIPWDVSQGIFSGTVSQYIYLIRKTFGTKIFLGYVPGYDSTSAITMIYIYWFVHKSMCTLYCVSLYML